MVGFVAGLATGCLIGVSGMFFLLLLSSSLPRASEQLRREISPRGMLMGALIVLAVGESAHLLHMHKSGFMLVLLLTLMLIAHWGNVVTSLTAALVSSLVAAVFVLPPIGSLRIAQPHDRLALAIFILISIVSCSLISAKRLRGPA